jgi:hypothetical protein
MKSVFNAIFDSLESLHRKFDSLQSEVKSMSVKVSDVQAAIDKAAADITTLLTDVSTQVSSLKAQITGLQGAAAPDLSGLLSAAQALDATVQGGIATFAPVETATDVKTA